MYNWLRRSSRTHYPEFYINVINNIEGAKGTRTNITCTSIFISSLLPYSLFSLILFDNLWFPMNPECPRRHRIQCRLHVEMVSRKMCSTLETKPRGQRFQTWKHWLPCKNRKNVYKNLTTNSLRRKRRWKRAGCACRQKLSINFSTDRQNVRVYLSQYHRCRLVDVGDGFGIPITDYYYYYCR